MTPVSARHILYLAASASMDPRERALGVVCLAGEIAAASRPGWWAWTVWLSCAITAHRIVSI